MPTDQVINRAKRWTRSERALLDIILEQLIPASADGKIPSAATLGVADFLALQIDQEPTLDELYRQGLESMQVLVASMGIDPAKPGEHNTVAMVENLEQQSPDFFATLLRHTYMGYYSNASVRPLFGLSSEPTQPDGYAVPPEEPQALAALTEPVVRRGKCFRDG